MHKDWSNVDWFDFFALRFLGRLYECFPISADFNPGDEPGKLDLPAFDDYDKFWAATEVPAATLKWLIDEGYVRCESKNMDGHYYGLVLTQRGLAAMKRVPASLTPDKSWGERARDFAGEAASSLTLDGIKVLAAGILGSS